MDDYTPRDGSWIPLPVGVRLQWGLQQLVRRAEKIAQDYAAQGVSIDITAHIQGTANGQ